MRFTEVPQLIRNSHRTVTQSQLVRPFAGAAATPPFAHLLIQRRTRDGYIWVYRYTAAFDDSLRGVIRDEQASEGNRLWAMGILQSWGIALDPAIYPFAASWTRRPSRQRKISAKGVSA